MRNGWRADRLPNGVWEVVEVVVNDESFSYHTIARGITREQAQVLASKHNEALYTTLKTDKE